MKTLFCALALGTLALSAAPAFADCSGSQVKKVRNTLSAHGYTVIDVDCRDDDDDGPAYEVDTVKDGRKYELWLNENMKIIATHNWWD